MEAPEKRIIRLYRAVKDISRLSDFTLLQDSVRSGENNSYTLEELDVAKTLYHELILYDVKNKNVTLKLLKVARNPKLALNILLDRPDKLDRELKAGDPGQ